MVRNERYRGVVHWNTSEWRKDPDSGKRRRIARPRTEWISYVDESMRIGSDELWESAQRRHKRKDDDKQLKSGGKPRFLLSGLLICDTCSAHYTIANQTSYGCSSYHNGHACSNSIQVRRDRIESILLDPIRKELLSPKRAEQMAKEMQAYFIERSQEEQVRAAERPHELRPASDAESAHDSARSVRRRDQAGSAARWWADSPLEPASRRFAEGPRDKW